MATNETKRAPAVSAEVMIDPSRGGPAGVIFTFGNGEQFQLRIDQLSTENQLMAACHGIKQKIIDAAAISVNPDTGRSASVEDKFQAAYEVYARLASGGTWNKVRGTGEGAESGLLLAALVRLYDGRKTRAELVEYLEGKSKAEQAALRANSRIAPIIATIKAERGGVDPESIDLPE